MNQVTNKFNYFSRFFFFFYKDHCLRENSHFGEREPHTESQSISFFSSQEFKALVGYPDRPGSWQNNSALQQSLSFLIRSAVSLGHLLITNQKCSLTSHKRKRKKANGEWERQTTTISAKINTGEEGSGQQRQGNFTKVFWILLRLVG